MKFKLKRTPVLTMFLCLLAPLLLSMLTTGAQTGLKKQVSLSFNAEPLDAALHKLETAAGFTLGYDARSVARYNAPEIVFDKVTADSVLAVLLTSTTFTYKSINGYIVITAKDAGTVSGKIIDEANGQAVPGVTVRIGNQGVISDEDGRFSLKVSAGKYTAEISSIGYVKKLVTDINITENQTFELNVTLKREKGQLSGVVISASARHENIASLFSRQKNAAGLSDGISAEQIGATPDKHIGESLKRITGVSTVDNRKVVVRGIAERYNVTLLDGAVMPSTDVQDRDFEFNLIPTNLIDNVTVMKSITPDMPYGFAGGSVQLNTKSIPNTDFTAVSAGVSYNTRTTGKDFLGYARGKSDYFAFDDGSRHHFPAGMFYFGPDYNPRGSESQNPIKFSEVGAQNQRIGGTERLGTRTYTAAPSQNYQFSIGRSYSLSNMKPRTLGFVGSLSYRNTQVNDDIKEMRRGGWSRRRVIEEDETDNNAGNVYGFNTTIAALLNGGFKTDKHQIITQNLYTRMFEDRFSRITGWTQETPKDPNTAKYPSIEEDDRPKFSTMLQTKLSGTHQFNPLKVTWMMARTELKTLEEDAVAAALGGVEYGNKTPLFQYGPGSATDPGWGTVHRDKYEYNEKNLSAELNAAVDFKLGKSTHTFKTGGNYLYKHAYYNWVVLPIVTADYAHKYGIIPIQEWGNYMGMDKPQNDIFYFPAAYSINGFEGESNNKGVFVMLDDRILPNLRLVWGVRADYFKMDTIKNSAARAADRNSKLIFSEQRDWFWLPSANLTYTPFKNLNLRGAYGESVVRPGLMENSRFSRYNPNYGTILRSDGVQSTLVKNYDVKLEIFPGPGEIISAGYFYKYFDKPAEYYAIDRENTGRPSIVATNSDWAKVKGWEFELRKQLGFINPKMAFLKNIFVSGNLTLQTSKVRARNREVVTGSQGQDSAKYTYVKYPRVLYGQVPLLYNAGLQYNGKALSLNLVYNYMGYKTFITGSNPDQIEYERPRGQLDAQIAYRLLKGKMEAKLNMSNLTDAPFRFFVNDASTYEYKPDKPTVWEEWDDAYRYKFGFSEKYESGYTEVDENGITKRMGDRNTFTRYIGRTFSFSLSYNF